MKDEYQQLWSGSWYKLDSSYHHQCCECSLVHSVDFMLKDGVIFQRWTIRKGDIWLPNRLAKN